MTLVKDIVISIFIGLVLVSAAAIGIFMATLGMCGLCLLGAS